jgi:hypothetical protein
MRRWKGLGHSLKLALALAAVLTLASFAPATFAQEMLSSLDRSVDTAVKASDQTDSAAQPVEPSPEPTPEPSPEPTPEPSPEPTPEPSPEPTPEPTSEPSPKPTSEPSPEPTSEPSPPRPTPTPKPAPEPPATTTGDSTATTGLFGPWATYGSGSDDLPLKLQDGGVGRSIIGESAQGDSGLVLVIEEIIGGGAGLIQSVTSILEGLASAGDPAVGEAEGMSPCSGSECESTFDGVASEALILVLICVILAVAGMIAFGDGRRRSNTGP